MKRVDEVEVYAFKDETAEDILADTLSLTRDDADWSESPRRRLISPQPTARPAPIPYADVVVTPPTPSRLPLLFIIGALTAIAAKIVWSVAT